MGGSPWIVAENAQEIAAARLVQLLCSNQCLRERYAVRDGPWIAAGDAQVSTPARCDQLRCRDECV